MLIAHEALSDTPAFLATRRLMGCFRCSAREAAGLAELFLALDAGPAVLAHYEREARRVGVASIIEDLVHLVARLALVEEVAATDAFREAEPFGDGVDRVDQDGRVAQLSGQSDRETAQPSVQWHALGTVHPEGVRCPVCRAVLEADDEAADLPTLSEVRSAG